MIELLRRAAADGPRRPAVVTHDGEVTYGELVARAESLADGLVERGISRIATYDGDAATILALLAAASAVGVEVCQYPPAEPDAVPGLLARFSHAWLLVGAGETAVGAESLDVGDVRVVSAEELAGVSRLASLAPRPPGTVGGRACRDQPPSGARPHLVLTTGTTGAPRGVRHDWDRLLRSVRRLDPAPDQRWLLAYGLHQFAGLQVLLHVAAVGGTLVAPAPRRPREGLRAMRELGVTHASATPTYWRFLLTELRADSGPVPDLVQVTLGGEAVPGPLLERLEKTFPTASVSQVYAASEFGSSGSVRDRRAGLSVEVLQRGADADVAMKVVDGELWVRSRTGMLGYHGEPAVDDPDGWRATGDLVEVVGDRIEFRGRVSEVINVGGVKVHPLPIEERVGAVPGVALARVWGRPNKLTGAIVAVDVVAEPDADSDAVAAAIRQACADLAPAARPRSIRFTDDVATRGGKIVRQAAREEGTA